MTSSKMTFDGGEVEVRSKDAKFPKQYLAHKAHVSDSEFPHDSEYVVRFLLRCVELPNIASQKIDVILFH